MAWDKNEPQELIGASAKLAAAERMRQAARASEGGDYEVAEGSQLIPGAVVFVLAAGLVMLLPEDFFSKLLGSKVTGVESVDQLLVGTATLEMTGSADMDHLITVFVRGFVLFLMAGMPPFLASLMARALGKHRLNALVACWGILLTLPLLYLLWGSF